MDAFNLYQSFKFCILYFSIYPGFATSIMLVTHFENLRLVSSSSFPKCKPAIFYISFSFFYSNTVRVDAINQVFMFPQNSYFELLTPNVVGY